MYWFGGLTLILSSVFLFQEGITVMFTMIGPHHLTCTFLSPLDKMYLKTEPHRTTKQIWTSVEGTCRSTASCISCFVVPDWFQSGYIQIYIYSFLLQKTLRARVRYSFNLTIEWSGHPSSWTVQQSRNKWRSERVKYLKYIFLIALKNAIHSGWSPSKTFYHLSVTQVKLIVCSGDYRKTIFWDSSWKVQFVYPYRLWCIKLC